LYSLDDNYVYSGSNDTNIRCWKTEASKPNKILSVREKTSLNYRKKLQEKFKYNPEVKRIIRKRNLPKYIVNKNREKHVQKESKYRKLKNMEMNSKPGTVELLIEKKDNVLKSGVIEK
jgi:WD repeat and SOF domain-containing protein 1